MVEGVRSFHFTEPSTENDAIANAEMLLAGEGEIAAMAIRPAHAHLLIEQLNRLIARAGKRGTETPPAPPARWRLPSRRESENFSLEFDGHVYEIGVSPPEGPIGELFIYGGVRVGTPRWHELHAGCWMLSHLLQFGMPVEELRASLRGSLYAAALGEALRLRGEAPE